MYELNAFGLAI